MKTFGQMKVSINNWARETIDEGILNDTLNDGIESLWMSCLLAQLETFMGGPTTVQLAAASERTQLVSIADPAVQLVVNQVASGALGPRNLVIAYTLVTDSGSETNLSPTVAVAVLANQVCSPVAPAPVANAFGWNLYAGSTAALMCQQNIVPLPFAAPVANEPNTGFKDAPGGGPLPPTDNSTADDIFYIRHMEVQLTYGGYKSWNQADIDSELFRRAARSISSTSEYQNYYWDLVNGRQLEFRPILGAAMSPRYFYIHRPRRIIFDDAAIPFNRFPCEAFLRAYALSNIQLVNEELQTSQSWEGKAGAAKMEIIRALTQMNHGKDASIAPFMY